MIELLFAGKKKSDGEWVEGNGIVQGQDPVNHFLWVDICTDTTRYEVIPETVRRFTGLTDKNGKKIFEGDIIWIDGENYVVIFEDGAFCIKKESYNVYICDGEYGIIPGSHEVIGNIHDNPELSEV